MVPKQQQKTATTSKMLDSPNVITLNNWPSEAIGMATTPITDIKTRMVSSQVRDNPRNRAYALLLVLSVFQTLQEQRKLTQLRVVRGDAAGQRNNQAQVVVVERVQLGTLKQVLVLDSLDNVLVFHNISFQVRATIPAT